MFIRSLDERELEIERMEQILGEPQKHIFPEIYRNSYGVEVDGKELRWSYFKDKPAEEMYCIVDQFVFPFIKEMGDGSAFSKAMEGATFGFPAGKPALLERAVDGVEGLLPEFDNNIGDLGDLYEYMLSKLSTAGTNGQFRTPKHIRDMMVAIVDPKPSELICDPACGTAGFLISSAEHIRDKYEGIMSSADWSGFAGTDNTDPQFSGFEMDQTMLRISAKNNDIPDILERWANLGDEVKRDRTEKSFLVPKQEIVDNDYDFSFNKYTKTEYERIEYPPTNEILADLEELNSQMSAALAELKAMLGGEL